MTNTTSAYEPLKIEVLPANSNLPILVKDRGSPDFKPIPASAQIVPYHKSPHTPTTLPPKQAAQFQSQ